jgi:hypothetical protein
VLGEHARDQIRVGDIALDEPHARILERRAEVQQTPGVGQLVEDDETVGGVGEGVVNEVGADEAGSPGDKKRSQV